VEPAQFNVNAGGEEVTRAAGLRVAHRRVGRIACGRYISIPEGQRMIGRQFIAGIPFKEEPRPGEGGLSRTLRILAPKTKTQYNIVFYIRFDEPLPYARYVTQYADTHTRPHALSASPLCPKSAAKSAHRRTARRDLGER
jgi:hypothetical protein